MTLRRHPGSQADPGGGHDDWLAVVTMETALTLIATGTLVALLAA